MDIPVPISPKFGRRFWQTHAKACTASGYSRSEYCRQHNLSYHTLTYWVRKQQRSAPDQPAMSLVEVPVPPLSARLAVAAFRLHLAGGYLLEIDPAFDDAALGRLLAVLAQH